MEVLAAVPGAAESLEHGFGEGRDARGEPRGHGVLDRQVRPVSSGRPQELARQERLAGHPVSVIGRRVRPVGAPSFWHPARREQRRPRDGTSGHGRRRHRALAAALLAGFDN